MKTLKRFPNILLALLLITGCTIRIIAPYDEVADKKVSDLQEKMVVKFKEWERKVPAFAADTAFYDHSEAVLEILIARNQSIEKSDVLVQMLQKVQSSVALIKEEHRKGKLNKSFVDEIKPDIIAQFKAIQEFQAQLRMAEEKQ